MSIRIEVWGPYGCYSRPELKTERVSYDVITPSAARGLVESIYWHPGLRYTIDRIYLLSPIQFTNIRRNEVKSTLLSSAALSAAKGGTPPVLYASQDIQQRAAMVLQDVHYVIECHFTMTNKAAPGDNPGKFQDILRRRYLLGHTYEQIAEDVFFDERHVRRRHKAAVQALRLEGVPRELSCGKG